MARRFRGEGHHKVDTKGRVSIPASFRRVLEAEDPNWPDNENPELVIVYGDHRRKFLECYTMQAIEEVDAKIERLPRGSMQRKMLERLFNGQSYPTNVDETGRLVLPAKLRTKIELELGGVFHRGRGYVPDLEARNLRGGGGCPDRSLARRVGRRRSIR